MENDMCRNIIVLMLSLACVLVPSVCSAEASDDCVLRDSTLRVDYIFSGTDSSAVIALDRMSFTDGWYGRRVNMDTVPVGGNGRITMKDAETGKVLYCNSFSTLFQDVCCTSTACSITVYASSDHQRFCGYKVLRDDHISSAEKDIGLTHSAIIRISEIVILHCGNCFKVGMKSL